MFKILFGVIGLTGILTAGIIQQWKFIDKNAAIQFKVINDKSEIETEGSIAGLQGGAFIDENNLVTKIEATVNVKTINTGVEMRDESLVSKDFFEVDKFAKISFLSSDIKTGITCDTARGLLTIKNKAKAQTILFNKKAVGDSLVYSGKFEINRLDFGVGDKTDGVGTKVIIDFKLPTIKQ